MNEPNPQPRQRPTRQPARARSRPKAAPVRWEDRTPADRNRIASNRRNVKIGACPFSGKNRAQRNRLHNGFGAMNAKAKFTTL